MYRKILLLLTLVGAAFLNGCASVPMASLEDDTARKNFSSPSPGTAGLYIYRNTNLGGALKKFIYIDGELVAETGPMTYFYFEVQGGKRKLSTESEFSENDLIVEVENGKNYFVQQAIKLGVFVGGAKLVLVPEAEGTKGVLECKLADNLNGNVMVNTAEIKIPETTSQSISGSEISAFEYYDQAEEEINTQTYDKNLWARALVETEGDQNKRKTRYIELRANQLYIENGGSMSTTSLDEQPVPFTGVSSIDVSGTYTSEITGNFSLALGLDDPSPEVRLKQNGIEIKGSYGFQGGKIFGHVDGNIINFKWIGSGSKDGTGKWIFNQDRSAIEGSWITGHGIDMSGTWRLTKRE